MEAYIGMMIPFAGNFAPTGWHLCDGSLLSISQYTAVFSILGTTYGGNGQSTFALPDLRGRVAIGAGTGPGLQPYTLGEQIGTENVTLLTNQMPAHNHMVQCTATATVANPAGNIPAIVTDAASGGSPLAFAPAPTGPNPNTMATTMISVAGGNQPHPNIQPSLGVTWIICMEGIFPTRN